MRPLLAALALLLPLSLHAADKPQVAIKDALEDPARLLLDL